MHQCPVCSRSFPTPYKLQRHHVIHTGQKPFNCKICGKAFTQSGHLKIHLEKVHRSQFPPGILRGGNSRNYQQPIHDKPAVGMSTHGSSSDCNTRPSLAFQPEWRGGSVTHNMFQPLSETGNQAENRPHVKNGSVTLSSISSDMDPTHQDQVQSANMETSACETRNTHTCKVCLKIFSSSLHLCIHSATHNKTKPFQRGQIFSRKACSKMWTQPGEVSSSTSKMTRTHQCPKCLKSFCSPSKLRRHFLIHTGQKPYSCTVCWKTFRQKAHLKSHLSTAYKCSLATINARKTQRLCNESQTSVSLPQTSLQEPTAHHALVNSPVELKLQCKISVNTMQDLNKTGIKLDAVVKPEQILNTSNQCQSISHLPDEEQPFLTQKDTKPFQCTICTRSFWLEVNLIRHQKIHKKQKELGSTSHVQNSSHVKISVAEAIKHSPKPSHACPIDLNIVVKPETWSEISPQEPVLKASTEQHRKTCPSTSKQQRIKTSHQCDACSKSFPSGSKLQRHMMTHTGQRPFGCEICGKRFRQKTHLRVHFRTHLWSRYQKQRSLYINRPPSRMGGFNTKTAEDNPIQGILVLGKDIETHSDAGVTSMKHLDETSSVMTVQNNDHREPEHNLSPHTSKRNDASKVNVKRTQKKKSTQNPGNVQHKCFQCFKCFPSASKLLRHEMVHTGLKPFQCATCAKLFRQASHLKTHERVHRKRKPPKSADQQVNVRKQRLYPRITVRIPPQHKCESTDTTHSRSAATEGESALLCTGREIPLTKGNAAFKTNTKSNTRKTKKLNICRICCKNFASPYKLSRHLVTHFGIRPYKCSLCSKTFTQRGHLNIHEQKCKQVNRMSNYDQMEIINTDHLQTEGSDINVEGVGEQTEPQYISAGHNPFTANDSSSCTEAVDTEWMAVPGLEKGNNALEKNLTTTNYSQTTESCNQATDGYNYSFPSELAFEISKLVQSQNIAASPLLGQYEGNAHDVGLPYQHGGITAIVDTNRLLGVELVSSVDANETEADFRDNYWCEPLDAFDCDKCTESFNSKNDFKDHLCSASVQPEVTKLPQKNRCDLCFKNFVTPSKLRRHYLIHTGQRPYKCDICGKTFRQSSHLRTHRLTH